MMTTIQKALELGKYKRAKELLEEYFKEQDYQSWLKERSEEYDKLFPSEKKMTDEEKTEYDAEHFSEEDPKPEGFEYPKVKIDYSDNPNYKTFEEWLNEEEVTQEEITDDDGIVTQEEIKEKIREFTPEDYTDKVIEFMKPYLYIKLQSLVSLKKEEVYSLIAGMPVTKDQVDNYKEKEKWAREDKDDLLATEAEIQGVDVETLKGMILQMADQWNAKYDYFLSMIETFRIGTGKLIENGDLNKSLEVLEMAEKFDKNTTMEQIRELFI